MKNGLPTAGVLYAATTRRIVAACSIGIWIGVIFFGRYLPYLGAE